MRKLLGRVWSRAHVGAATRRLLPRRLSTDGLIEFTRSVKFFLRSGMMLRDAMRLLKERGSWRVRPVAGLIAGELESGWSFRDALEKQPAAFPPLFVALAAVGEESGNLPEVMADLEAYYDRQARRRREFLGEIASPVLQFVLAVVVIAGLIYLLGVLPAIRQPDGGSARFDALGLGLLGADGAVRFLAIVFGSLAAVVVLFLAVKRAFSRRAVVERALLHVPLLGSCLRAGD